MVRVRVSDRRGAQYDARKHAIDRQVINGPTNNPSKPTNNPWPFHTSPSEIYPSAQHDLPRLVRPPAPTNRRRGKSRRGRMRRST